MNVSVVKWLLANRKALQQMIDASKGWHKDMPYLEQWEVVDQIARILLPILDPQSVSRLMAAEPAPTVVSAMALGAEVQALGVDWKLVVEVIIPIIISILQAISNTP